MCERTVDRGSIESLRIEVRTEAREDRSAQSGPAPQRGRKNGVVRDRTAGIIERPGKIAVQADDGGLRRGTPGALSARDAQPPFGAVVIDIGDGLTSGRESLHNRQILAAAVLAGVARRRTVVRGKHTLGDLESVRMVVTPAHDRLQDPMQLAQTQISRDSQDAPDERLDLLQFETKYEEPQGHCLQDIAGNAPTPSPIREMPGKLQIDVVIHSRTPDSKGV